MTITAAPSGRATLMAAGIRSNLLTWMSYVILLVLAILILTAPFLTPHPPNQQDLTAILLGPSPSHWLGTDDLGRDVFSRMIVGSRSSVISALYSVVLAMGIGIPLGILAGWASGLLDSVIMRVVDAVLSFPAIVLALGITATLGPGLTNAMTAVALVLSPEFCRLARARVLSIKQETFIEAAQSFGARGIRRMILRHVLPNAIQPLLVQAALLVGFALIAEASLSFLHLGIQPPNASWGSVLARGYTFMDRAPLQVLIPGLAIALTVFALNIIGDDIQRRLDPKRRNR